jgi:hypothetical protein
VNTHNRHLIIFPGERIELFPGERIERLTTVDRGSEQWSQSTCSTRFINIFTHTGNRFSVFLGFAKQNDRISPWHDEQAIAGFNTQGRPDLSRYHDLVLGRKSGFAWRLLLLFTKKANRKARTTFGRCFASRSCRNLTRQAVVPCRLQTPLTRSSYRSAV